LFAGAFGSGDTWEWDGTNWTQALPATQPPVRQQTAMAFDAQRGVCLLFGGWDGNVGLRFGDTWEWNGINWTQRLPATQPAPRTGHALVYDAARARIAMFGGSTGGGESAETWLWDGVNWTLANAVPSPTARERFAFAYDAASARTLLFGGNDGNADLGDTWTWDGAQWTQIGGQPGSEPGPRHQASMAYDAARGRVQLVGGSIVSLGAFPQPAPGASDLWEWDGAAWHLLLPASFQPPARSGYVIARDATRQETVMFGGDGSVLANETWIWNGVDWAQRFPLNRPLACRGHTLTYDPVRQQILLFGGNTTNQTWTWDGATWTLRSPAASPPARLWHAAVFDRRQQRVVMFGGYGYSAQNALADTWEWDGNNWLQRAPATNPPPRVGPLLVYDAARDRAVLTGGQQTTIDSPVLQDTWEWNGIDWLQRTLPAGTPGRSVAAGAFDEARAQLVRYGGIDAAAYGTSGALATVTLGDVWEYGSLQQHVGTGCAGSNGTPILDSLTPLRIGHLFTTTLRGLASGASLAEISTGFSSTSWPLGPLPTPLDPLGMLGCTAWCSADALLFLPVTGGVATLNIAVPANAVFIGLPLFQQGMSLDPGINPAGIAVSNAIGMVVGN
jgi:hypothetical protein